MNKTSIVCWITLGITITSSFKILSFTPNGYCSVPVADLVIAPIQTLHKMHASAETLYTKLPFDDTDHGKSCRRIGQLLLHDPVEIIEYKDNEVCIITPQWQYATNPEKSMHYWTLRSNIIPYTGTIKKYVPSNIPLKAYDQTIVALIKPWYDKQTKQTYSVGTRFITAQPTKRNPQHKYTVWCLNKGKLRKLHIPKTHLIVETEQQLTKARTLFVQFVTSWSYPAKHTTKHHIPYVLGGSSYTTLTNITVPKKDSNSNVATGFDCSHLITRAAQLAGIPLYAANSTMLIKQLRPLSKNEKIENGDIIYFPGHVIAITDIKKSLITEARSSTTNNGYGLVQTIPLHEQFKDIKTIDQLVAAYHSQEKITRINKNGKVIKIRISIFKLC